MTLPIGLTLAIDRLIKVAITRHEYHRFDSETSSNQRVLIFTCTEKGVAFLREAWDAVNRREKRCEKSFTEHKNPDGIYSVRLTWSHPTRTFLEGRSMFLAEELNAVCLRHENATELHRSL